MLKAQQLPLYRRTPMDRFYKTKTKKPIQNDVIQRCGYPVPTEGAPRLLEWAGNEESTVTCGGISIKPAGSH